MIPSRYLNEDGNRLFKTFSPAQEKWAWKVVKLLRERYPTADQWTTGGQGHSYTDLRFGARKPGKSASSVLFRISLEKGSPTCRLAWWMAKHHDEPLLMTPETHPTSAAIEAWLDRAAKIAGPNENRWRSAEGRVPADYADNDEGEDTVEEVVPPAGAEGRSRPALNTILFGPPGTGKTYATIDESLEILDPALLEANPEPAPHETAARMERRRKLKARFDQLVREQRVRFVTFHQSFSYEDFVEGVRATPGENGSLRYDVEDGVFKVLCDSASAQVSTPQGTGAPIDPAGRRIWKMSLGNSTLADEAAVYDDCIARGVALLGYGAGVDFTGSRTRNDIVARFMQAGQQVGNDDFAVTAVNAFVVKMKPGDLVVVSDGNFKFRAIGLVEGEYQFVPGQPDFDQSRKVRWLRRYEPSLPHSDLMTKQFSQMTIYEPDTGSIDLAKLRALLAEKATGETSRAETPRVLIIDEINRGNVSRIFGELITLIEPSKRAGAEEALSVTLPYSKRTFSVPANVHLLGTMNTADRSLTGLDVALRRRFTFKEMPPRPKLLDHVQVQGVNIGDLLQVMNERIEVLLDREHCVGHAYFMRLAEEGANTLPALASIFRRQIVPLLQEYFFEDWERIGWVLNDPAKSSMEFRFVRQPRGDLSKLFGQDNAGRIQDRRWILNEAAFGEIESYRQILQAAM